MAGLPRNDIVINCFHRRGLPISPSANFAPGSSQKLSLSRIAAVTALCFAALLLSHLPLLRLPYFWDEAGYYIPAARDLFLTGSLIPHSTPSNAHPPLIMAWLALAWKIFGYSPLVTRIAMLLIAAFGLAGIFELAESVATRSVAIASVICAAGYPVFFAQSSLAQVDLPAAVLISWALVFYLRRRLGWSALWFTLAALAKETSILAPAALFLWEIFSYRRDAHAGREDCHPERERRIPKHSPPGTLPHAFRRTMWLLFPILPLAAWFAYHYSQTGYIFGNPEFFRYNVVFALQPLHILFTFIRRGWQLTGYMSLYALTLATALAMFFPPQPEGRNASSAKSGPTDRPHLKQRIAIPTQLAFAAIIVCYWLALSLIGGAVLARYLLPAIPLLIILCVSTLRRRVPGWPALIVLICAAFASALFINPPYSFAPEDNLAYRDFTILHQHAANFLERNAPTARILTAWPATGELAHPWLGYVASPLNVYPINNPDSDFTAEHLEHARSLGDFDAALVFSTKYYPPHPLPLPAFWQRAQVRFFGYHQDASPALAAQILGGQIVYEERRGGQWIAVIMWPELRNAQNIHQRAPSS